MIRLRQRLDAHDGSTVMFVAIMLPVLLGFVAFGLGGLVLVGGERELQRAADAGALATAAQLPLVDLGATPIVGGQLSSDGGAADRGCDVAERNLAAGRYSSRFTTAAPTCAAGDITVSYELDPALSALLAELPAIESASSTLASLGIDGSAIAPVAITPRVRVDAAAALQPPLVELLRPDQPTVDAAATGVARRRFKNAVLVPILDLQGRCPTDLLGLVLSLLQPLQNLLGDAASITELADELYQCRADINPTLDQAGHAFFPQVEEVGDVLDALGLPGSELTQLLLTDLRDVYDPSDAGAPTQQEILEAAAAQDEDILVVLVGVTDATAIPLLDVFPARADDLQTLLASGTETEVDDLLGLAQSSGAANGMFRASLVE